MRINQQTILKQYMKIQNGADERNYILYASCLLKRKEEMLARKKALAESQLSQQDKENNELEAKQKLEK